MLRTIRLLSALIALAWTAQAKADGAGVPRGVGVAAIDFQYSDSSGEENDQTSAHRDRLAAFMQALRADLAARAGDTVVTPVCQPEPCEFGRTPGAEIARAAKAAGAKVLVVGAIHKESTLVQWMKTTIVDIDTGNVLTEKLMTFRGDTDEAWRRAEAFVIEDLFGVPKSAAAPATIKLAVFPFELEDFSAAGSLIPPDDIDREQLRLATEEARRLIAQSARYQVIALDDADGEAAKAHKLRDCEGCDAPIAAARGADQSMIGIVTRISRTEYAVTYKIRDAHTGAPVAVEQTDVRMGANYAWSRGARWLIEHRLLANSNPP